MKQIWTWRVWLTKTGSTPVGSGCLPSSLLCPSGAGGVVGGGAEGVAVDGGVAEEEQQHAKQPLSAWRLRSWWQRALQS